MARRKADPLGELIESLGQHIIQRVAESMSVVVDSGIDNLIKQCGIEVPQPEPRQEPGSGPGRPDKTRAARHKPEKGGRNNGVLDLVQDADGVWEVKS